MTFDFGEHSRSFLRFALSLTGSDSLAEDLMQETMLRVLKQQHAEKLPELANPRAWLFAVAINIWRDRSRQRKRRGVTQSLHLVEEPIAKTGPEETETREYLSQVVESFQQLPDLQREVLYLRAVEGFSIAEIARMTETSENSVKASLSIARKRMRKRFGHSIENQIKS